MVVETVEEAMAVCQVAVMVAVVMVEVVVVE
jgi:hypothetical protein